MLTEIGKRVKNASVQLAVATTDEKNRILKAIADALRENCDEILKANAIDIENFKYVIGNKDWFDTTYKYDKAIIALQDGTIVQGEVQNWTDYEDGDQLQVKVDGKVYLVHSSNVTLIKER